MGTANKDNHLPHGISTSTFTYDPFQKQAIDFVDQGYSVIVSAPTGAGKTAIAEYVIETSFAKNTSVIYTAPLKALSNQKFRQFQERFGDRVGILTGDVSINPDAPMLIMTTEIFRNKVIENEPDLARFSWIIFDEVHFLDDYERGTVWEESIIFLPENMNILALSATVPNIHEIARWIETIHHKGLKVVIEKERPVPLHFYYQCGGDLYDDIHTLKTRLRNAGKRYAPHAGHFKPSRADSLIKYIHAHNGLPCIYFAFGRKRCEYLAREISRFAFLSDEERTAVRALFDQLSVRFNLSGERSAALMAPLIERGIAFHHAGMLPTLKEVVERLFTSRLIKVIFTTETFALGINMPARTVVFDQLIKFYGRYHRSLRTRDFYQMAGRAGRRGLDTEGFVYSRVNPFDVTFQDVQRMVYGTPEPVLSQFNASYATVIHLYARYKERLYDIYQKSLHCFQTNDQARRRALDRMKAKVALLKELGYIANGHVTEKGDFASQVYGYELPLGELYDERFFERLSSDELAHLALAMVFEPRKGLAEARISPKVRRLKHTTDSLVHDIQRIEKRFRTDSLSKQCHFHLSACLDQWMAGKDFHTITALTDVDEGEIIRYFRMSIQVMREMSIPSVSPAVRERLRAAIYAMNRDWIDAEKQLRME